MSTKWNNTSWQKEFLEIKAHKPSDVRLLMKGAIIKAVMAPRIL